MKYKKKHYQHQYTSQQHLELVSGGSEYFNLLHTLIDKARECIHIQMYIFAEDDTGLMVVGWLKAAAARGVKVYMLFDGYATQNLSKQFLAETEAAGIYIERFDPLFKTRSLYFGRRMHHKIVVIDGTSAMVGSGNIDNKYNDIDGQQAWLDMALYVEGSVAGELETICIKMWNSAVTSDKYIRAKPAERPAVIADENSPGYAVRVRRNDWVKNKHEIWRSYFDLLNRANHDVYIVSSYFLPGRRLRKQMKLAVQRGITIKIIIAGLSDVKIAKSAERYLYQWLLRNKIEIYEYQRSILHAKMGIRDGKWLTLGSYNVNNISTYASIELNLDVRNQPFVSTVQQRLDKIIAEDCVHITKETFRQYNTLWQMVVQKIAYNIIRFLLYLSTFYFKNERPIRSKRRRFRITKENN